MASKAKTETSEETPAAELLTLVVTANLSEGGVHYAPGETIELTPERAAALGGLVKEITGEQ